MKTITALAALLLLTISPGFGQDTEDITGRWSGVLEVQGMRLRLVFQIDTSEAGPAADVVERSRSADRQAAPGARQAVSLR
jgi:hypothetical protein